jgi:hypothetical protein
MVRSSMFIGWWQMVRNPRQFFRRPSLDNENLLAQGGQRVEAPPEPEPAPIMSEKEAEAGDVQQYERRRTSDTLVE